MATFCCFFLQLETEIFVKKKGKREKKEAVGRCELMRAAANKKKEDFDEKTHVDEDFDGLFFFLVSFCFFLRRFLCRCECFLALAKVFIRFCFWVEFEPKKKRFSESSTFAFGHFFCIFF